MVKSKTDIIDKRKCKEEPDIHSSYGRAGTHNTLPALTTGVSTISSPSRKKW
jgi:hypothetical protein